MRAQRNAFAIIIAAFVVGDIVAIVVPSLLSTLRVPPHQPLQLLLMVIYPFLRLRTGTNGVIFVLSVIFEGIYYGASAFSILYVSRWSSLKARVLVAPLAVVVCNVTLFSAFVVVENLITGRLTLGR